MGDPSKFKVRHVPWSIAVGFTACAFACVACTTTSRFSVLNATSVPLCSVTLGERSLQGVGADGRPLNHLTDKTNPLAPGAVGAVESTYVVGAGDPVVIGRDCKGNVIVETNPPAPKSFDWTAPAGSSDGAPLILK